MYIIWLYYGSYHWCIHNIIQTLQKPSVHKLQQYLAFQIGAWRMMYNNLSTYWFSSANTVSLLCLHLNNSSSIQCIISVNILSNMPSIFWWEYHASSVSNWVYQVFWGKIWLLFICYLIHLFSCSFVIYVLWSLLNAPMWQWHHNIVYNTKNLFQKVIPCAISEVWTQLYKSALHFKYSSK